MNNAVTRELILEGLDCANCAAMIESRVNELDGVNAASLNFMTQTLKIEMESPGLVDDVLGQTRHIVNTLEPHVVIGAKDGATAHHKMGLSIDYNELIAIIAASALLALALIVGFPAHVELALFLLSYLLAGSPILYRAGRNIVRGQVFDENFLMALATLAALAIKQYPEAVAVMVFYRVGEFLQGLAVDRSRQSIGSLMDIRPDHANLVRNGIIEPVVPQAVDRGDIIMIKPGERVPLDGQIIEGASSLDTSALTGESLPRYLERGDEIMAGFLNIDGLLKVEVTRCYKESAVSRILDLVENAASRKAPTENFITRFAAYYTPAVVAAALALALIPPFILNAGSPRDWIYRALIFLVISCPCALVISVPMAFFAGIGTASRYGILVKGSNYLEALNYADSIVFDKTGTLTTGKFKVADIKTREGITPQELLFYAAMAERYSNHPLAISIREAYHGRIDEKQIEDYQEIPGHGIKAKIMGKEVLAGNIRLMQKENITCPFNAAGTLAHVILDGAYAGYIELADQLKPGIPQTLNKLKTMGIKKLIMLTGDKEDAASKIAAGLQLDEVYSELLPEDKVRQMELLEGEKSSARERLVFVGDGINDAPVLARSDLGVAMGGLGSDAAIEAADIVIMNDDPASLTQAINIARSTHSIVIQNIVFALVVKAMVLILGAWGLATMWQAVFADVGVTIMAVLNSLRIMQKKY